ncbi:NFACT family protein [Clostridium sp. SYSU_GA19001]|uniref:Rqc2 family fibronectin-binding protein n=1 Tax=Clostridium caldaquaticum TaxID=2940653 RepID=UPI002077589C|nr:NFACT RNA binding domain-containing protein [Clostridium caldaquaticum]MCM8711022.1 NFACT family protein [Clostridium caldaquaticum]
MPLDGIYIYSLVDELNKKLVGSRVDKISQPEKDEIILGLRGDRVNFKLLISANSSYPKMHLTDITKPNPIKAPMFCMVLRKYLNGAKILSINQITTDRIVIIDFESSDELGFNSIYSLIVEIMGRHSNITLVRKRNNLVVDCIKHITPDMNSYRSLYPGISYVFPPDSCKLNPFNFSYEDFCDFITSNSIKFESNIFSKLFTGISTQLSKSIVLLLKERNIEFNLSSLDKTYDCINNVFKVLKSNKFNFISYIDENTVKDFYCIELHQFENLPKKSYSSPSALLEDFYYEKDKSERLNTKSADLQKIINNNLDRCYKKLEILNKSLKECTEKDLFKIYGELLTANIYNIKKGDKKIKVLNYYSQDEEYIYINLDENKTPSENIQSFFKKYNKLKKTEEMALIQIEATEQEALYLQSVLSNIKNAESYDEIEEIKRELIETGYIKFKKEHKKNVKTSKPLHFISSDNIDIYVGKNNIQNDFLTLKFADRNDIWLHTKNIPGSHVIIKSNGNIPQSTLKEAAILAAYYSNAKNSSNVPVDYTAVKNVKKPSGAKPGMVIYYTNKTLYVTPYDLKLKKI